MSRTCARCNWRPEDDENLEEHAEAAEHPLCTRCSTSLPSDRTRSCRDCQDQAAVWLDEILGMWRELPDLLEAHASARLPGGDALVLAGPGSRGVQGSDDQGVQWWLGAGHSGPITAKQWRRRRDQSGALGGISDNSNADTPSVAWTLLSWEDDWRHTRGEPASALPPTSSAPVVEAAHAYLREHGPWAAAEHWAWAEYATDLAKVHAALLRVTDRHRQPTRLGLDCFTCGGPLQYRVIADRDAPPAPTRPRWWVAKGVAGPVDRAEYDRRQLSGAGLEENHATCRDCGQTYDAERLLLAQQQAVLDAQWLEDDDGTTWGTVRAVADHVERSEWTLRTWARQQLVRQSTYGGVAYLHLADVQAECELRAPRRPRTTGAIKEASA